MMGESLRGQNEVAKEATRLNVVMELARVRAGFHNLKKNRCKDRSAIIDQ